MGGYDLILRASTNQVLRLTRDWSFVPDTPMLSARRQFAIVVCQNKLFVLGGVENQSTADSGTNTVDVFDGSSWERHAAMTYSRRDFQAVCSQNRLYAIGGAILNLSDSSESYEESYDGSTWRLEQRLNIQRRGHSALLFHDHIFVFGGSTFGSLSPTDTIEVGTLTPTRRFVMWANLRSWYTVWTGATILMTGCMWNEKAWMIGGFDSFGARPTFDTLEGTNKTWFVDPARLLEELTPLKGRHLSV